MRDPRFYVSRRPAPVDGDCLTWDASLNAWKAKALPPGNGQGTESVGNIDGGSPSSNYAWVPPLNGGTP